jgi:hypothetical protein
MNLRVHTDATVEPILTKFAVGRSGDPNASGHYDEIRQVWVVETPSGWMPIVEAVSAKAFDPRYGDMLDLTTKTAQLPEQDDISPRILLVENITVTKVLGEQSDI